MLQNEMNEMGNLSAIDSQMPSSSGAPASKLVISAGAAAALSLFTFGLGVLTGKYLLPEDKKSKKESPKSNEKAEEKKTG